MSQMKQSSAKTNAEAYARYRRDIEESRRRLPVEEERLRSLDPRSLLVVVMRLWDQRSFRRLEALRLPSQDELNWGWLDIPAREVLVARHRAQISPYCLPDDFSQQQLERAEQIAILNRSEVKSLKEIPSYGPSLNWLWFQAKSRGLPKAEAAKSILEWHFHAPEVWARDDERKRNGLPALDPAVARRLEQAATFRSTNDLFVAWDAEVGGQRWEIRINDFPDEHMYSLLIDGETLGDFQDWPGCWDRGEKKASAPAEQKPVAAAVPPPPRPTPPAVLADPETLLTRYQAGECEAVWRDLMAVGPDVRKPPYEIAAQAVARETIRRAQHNFELIVQRLQSLNYQFLDGRPIYRPKKTDLQAFAACEEAGLLMPIVVRICGEEMFQSWLVGTHPQLCPEDSADIADPLWLTPTNAFDMQGMAADWQECDGAEAEPDAEQRFRFEVCAGPKSKLQALTGGEATEWYLIQLPNPAVDAPLIGEPAGRTLVEYLRWNFQWGGFPGWEKEKNRPEKELAFLRDGLLPI